LRGALVTVLSPVLVVFILDIFQPDLSLSSPMGSFMIAIVTGGTLAQAERNRINAWVSDRSSNTTTD